MARRQTTAEYKTEEGTVEITLQALGGTEGGLLALRLGGILGPGIAGIATAIDHDDSAGLSAAVNQLFAKVPPAEFKDLLKQLTAGAQGRAADEFHDVTAEWLNETFAGCPGSIFKLMFNAIKTNFSGFTEELGLSADLLTKLKNVGMKAAAKAAKA